MGYAAKRKLYSDEEQTEQWLKLRALEMTCRLWRGDDGNIEGMLALYDGIRDYVRTGDVNEGELFARIKGK